MTQRVLRLAKDLTLPIDAVTQTFLIVGKRGSGKSNTAARFVEQLHHAHIPFVVLDPVDTWWGLKAGRDGGKGLDVYVFGGRKADLPLEAGGGALIAEVLCEHRMPMVLSVKHLSGRERSTFMVAFAQTLFQKWGGGPLHVVLEEAHELAPQLASSRGGSNDGEAAMLGAFKRLWKLGRSSGIGGTAVTQRPASLSKDITTQSEILIAHRTIGPQDVKAIGEWVKYHGERLDILAELPSLPTGEAFVWAPEFPEGKAIGLQRTSILLRETYDSASTPKVGEQRVEPKELAAVDLERLRVKMAATIEKAKADDPRELRKQIAEKDKRIKQLETTVPNPAPNIPEVMPKRVEVLTDADRALLEKLNTSICLIESTLTERSTALIESLRESLLGLFNRAFMDAETLWEANRAGFAQLVDRKGFQKILAKLATVSPESPVTSRQSVGSGLSRTPNLHVERRTPPVRPLAQPVTVGDIKIGVVHRAFLTVLANRQGKPTRRNQLAVFSGYSAKSRHVDNTISALRSAGCLTGAGDTLAITSVGLDALGPFEELPSGSALIDYWIREAGVAPGAMLRALVNVYPRTLSRDEVAEASNYSPTSRHVDNSLSYLRTLELITGDKSALSASEELFS